MRVLSLIFLTIFMLIIRDVRSDYYTSIVSLTDLLDAEMSVAEYLDTYLDRIESINIKINKTLAIMEQFVKQAEEDPEDHLGNPLNAFKLISRLVIDWEQLRRVVFDDTYANAYLTNVTDLVNIDKFELPTKDDLDGASKGLVRMQRTYAQETEDVAEGDLMEMNFSPPFSASDCFHLGRSLFDVHDYEYATEWLMEARIRLVKELAAKNNTYTFPYVTDVQILEYLSPAMYFVGNSKIAQLLNEELLAQDPSNKHGLQNIELYANRAREERRITYIEDNVKPKVELTKSKVNDLFERVCRGELRQTPRQKRDLRCRYVHNNVPFCFIAPYKKEELHLEPEVAYYHQVMYESEIEKIINATENYVERSKVGDLKSSIYSDIRTSQNTWLDIKTNDFLGNVGQRLLDITGLTLDFAEPLQVANYGIAGHYGPHYDFSENPNETYGGRGNRILTALFYINEVELGGGTAFPFLHLLAEPIKGSLVLWYDLHESLEFDYRTKHGGCPVLVGSKWICNEWFHEKGQEFTRPCGLKADGYKSIEYKSIR